MKNQRGIPLTTHEEWHADQAQSPQAEPEPAGGIPWFITAMPAVVSPKALLQ